ncbi:MAG: RecX family transcriptional regulator [Acidobacteria bacterium]|nr:RecX family transcriptional regulator [Acidobacteriota bacterium]
MWRKRLDLNEQRERFIADANKASERTMNRAVKLLAAKPRSVGELRERLLEKLWTDEAIVDGVLEKLKEYGYLDDQKFAGDLALSKLRQKPQGKRRLKQSLSQKRLSQEDIASGIESALEKLPESKLIDAAVEKRLRLKGRPETREDTKKFYDYLLRLGFDYDLIRSRITDIGKAAIIDETE